ncbi:MAG: T9SS type A sorting domain-containing protein [Paludibacter sp.]
MKKLLKLIQVMSIVLIPNFAFSQTTATFSNQWSATDGLGRNLPDYKAAGFQKNKFVGMFYWTWHTDDNAADSLMDITKILTQYPEAINNWNNPAWKGIDPGSMCWWNEPLFGYYRTTDEWILRKHAEMLADAGIDVVFFDCTNGSLTWKSSYTVLLKVWNQARKDGVKTPQIAFLLPFGASNDATTSINELYTDLYQPQLYKDLWFMWNNKPLIMAYPELAAQTASAAALKFTATAAFSAVNATCPSWTNNIGNLTMTLYKWNSDYATSVAGTPIATKTFINFNDNSKLALTFPQQPAGDYIWVMNNGTEMAGVWKWTDGVNTSVSYFNGVQVTGSYESEISYGSTTTNFTALTTGTQHTPIQISGSVITQQRVDEMKNFFTFRPGQADYVNGPSRNDQWGWLEVAPQHGYVPKSGGFEQAAVGVALNCSDASGGHASAFNRPETYGRSYTKANGQDLSPDAYFKGLNFQEQWNGASALNPDLIFVTGWNEWTAGRWTTAQWSNPGMAMTFVDEFSNEKSRDIEPVKSWGNKGDVYYNQLVANVRKFKGMSPVDTTSASKTINISNSADWNDVKPSYMAYRGNTLHRSSPGQGSNLIYTNTTGRNDIVGAKVARDDNYLYFMVQTDANLSPKTDAKWMRLFIDIDRDKSTGWEGYDFVVNRTSPTDSATVEKSTNSWSWSPTGKADYSVNGNMLVLKIKRSVFGIGSALNFEFKWSDNMQEDGNIMDFYVNGDAAPGGRFNYVYQTLLTSDGYRYSELPTGINHGLKSDRYDAVFDTIPNFANLNITATEYPTTFALANTSSTNYALVQTGFIDVPTKDIYTFSLNTDLTAKFYIGNLLVVKSTQIAGVQTGAIKLMPGKHSVRLEYITKAANTKLLDLKIQNSTTVQAPIQAQNIYKYNVVPSATLKFNRVQNYYSTADSVVVVSAIDPDGSVSKVEIYDSTQVVSTTLNNAAYTIKNFSVGNHKIFAKVYDNDGASSISNMLNFIVKDAYIVPGNVNITDYSNAANIAAVSSTDIDGGKNIKLTYGWLEYPISVPQTGTYRIIFRVPKSTSSNILTIKSNFGVIGTIDLANSAATATYYDVPVNVSLNAGVQTLRLEANSRLSTIHRIDISATTALSQNNTMIVNIYPNPSATDFIVRLDDEMAKICIYDVLGKMVEQSPAVERAYSRSVGAKLSPGVYILDVTSSNGAKQQFRIVKK